jgi:hypothetical protein
MNLSHKVRAKMGVMQSLSNEERDELMRVPWRLGFGLMQPKSVNFNPSQACGHCETPDLLMADCPWHGNVARRMIS